MTLMYFSSTDVPPVSPAFSGWDRTTEGVYRSFFPYKDRSPITGFTTFNGASPVANIRALAVMFVSPPMAAGVAFATAHQVKGVLQCFESAINDNINRAPIALKVFDFAGTTQRAALLSLGHFGPSTTEWDVVESSRILADVDPLAVSYTTVLGDRLTLEIGSQVSASGGTSVTGTQFFGAPLTPADLELTEGITTIGVASFDIATAIVFMNSTPCFQKRRRSPKQKW